MAVATPAARSSWQRRCQLDQDVAQDIQLHCDCVKIA